MAERLYEVELRGGGLVRDARLVFAGSETQAAQVAKVRWQAVLAPDDVVMVVVTGFWLVDRIEYVRRFGR